MTRIMSSLPVGVSGRTKGTPMSIAPTAGGPNTLYNLGRETKTANHRPHRAGEIAAMWPGGKPDSKRIMGGAWTPLNLRTGPNTILTVPTERRRDGCFQGRARKCQLPRKGKTAAHEQLFEVNYRRGRVELSGHNLRLDVFSICQSRPRGHVSSNPAPADNQKGGTQPQKSN